MAQLRGASISRKIVEPEVVLIPTGPVTLGVPAFPADSTLPHPRRRLTLDVPAFSIAKATKIPLMADLIASASGWP